MPTVVLNAISSAYPLITNRIKASVFKQTDLIAPIASEIDTTAGHPIRTWSFPGLPRDNYAFSLDEIDGGGLVVRNLSYFDVVPSQIDGLLCRDDEQIQVGVTTGFDAGLSSVTFDGSGGKPDYRGWEIVPSELTGRGILVRNTLDYTWDSVTGEFVLLQSGDILQDGTYWNIHFNPINQTAGNSYPTITDFQINLITSNTTLDDTYFGKKLICEPSGVYMEVQLPDISTIAEGRPLMVEVGGSGIKTVKFIPYGADVINWLRGNIYAMCNESFRLYAYNRSGVKEWRVDSQYGNYAIVGQSVGDDSTTVFNKKLLNGDAILATQYARLYNEIVLTLPGTQVVNYDDWATGNNKYLWSLANSANPANAGKFKIPDRRDLYERNNLSGKAGDYQAQMIKATGANITLPLVQHTSSAGTFGITDGPYGIPNTKTVACTIGTGTETRPETYLINKYVLV